MMETSIPAVASTSTSVGFKDWALVCTALGQGRQSLILRKGGIAEGRAGFRFKHEAFFLFPTQYHQQAERVRPEAVVPMESPIEGTVEIRYFFAVEWAQWIDSWPVILRLQPFHVWREDVVRERFEYGEERGLQCAFGRVYRLAPAWQFPDRPAYGGCRSWVTLPEFPAPEITIAPVLTDDQHETVANDVRAVMENARSLVFRDEIQTCISRVDRGAISTASVCDGA